MIEGGNLITPPHALRRHPRTVCMSVYIDEIKKKISQIVRFPSYQQPAEHGMPFGAPAAEALTYFLSLAKNMGFETHNYDNYAGEVIFGEGEEFAVLAHLDVVPAGSGWTHEPFGGEIDNENGRIWGRGTMDDKGPAVIMLYCLKALKDDGFVPARKIKLIVGCNEETGWACIDHYNKVAHMPEEGISPDADFPVIYAEKGIMHIKFTFTVKGAKFAELKGGERANMVCDLCTASADSSYGDPAEYGLALENGKVISRGKSAHGSTPDEGVNAIEPMLRYLKLDGIADLLFKTKFGLGGLEDETGRLTFSPDMVKSCGDEAEITCDVRYPATFTEEQILRIISGYGIPYKIIHSQAPLYGEKDSFLVKTLCDVYNEVCGTAAQPIAIGGGTYARALKRGAAFGPEEAGEESTIHQANEYITFEKIEKCFKIYKLALERLTK